MARDRTRKRTGRALPSTIAACVAPFVACATGAGVQETPADGATGTDGGSVEWPGTGKDAAPDVIGVYAGAGGALPDATGGSSAGGSGANGGSGGTGSGGCDVLATGFPSSLAVWNRNPVLVPTKTAAINGWDNVYAPDLHAFSGVYVMFYGAQGSDGHDRIFMAWSKNRAEWRKYPSGTAPAPVLDRGSSNHVNDPSAVYAGGKWRMYYTDAPSGIDDRIWLAESTTLTGFAKVQMVLDKGAAGSWEAEKVGRPSVLYEGGVYKMWYDGQVGGVRHVGYATSTDGLSFTRHPANPVFMNAGAIDVKKIGGVYVMVRESAAGTDFATSPDGICWVDRGKLFGLSGAGYDQYGQVTPFLDVNSGNLEGVWFGGASAATWDKNRIAVAWAPGFTPPNGGGCAACTSSGVSCSEACQSAGLSAGVCGNPGSATAGSCCACASEGCDGCKGSAKDCQDACVKAGKAGGWCAHPGSTNPGTCCACLG
jgi:hypothetical protein